MSQSGVFYPDPDPSPLIFSICWYRVPIRCLALTNIFLDNTAALRNKGPASKLFHNIFFFILLKQSIYFQMALSYSACYCNIGRPNSLCQQGWSVTADPHVQPPEVCVRCSPCLVPPSSTAFKIFFTLSHKMTWTCGLSISQCSAAPRLPVLHTLLYETRETSAHTGTL